MANALHLPLLINALGHVAGISAFGAFLFLLIRAARRAARAPLYGPVAAATLALLWNAGSLAVLVTPSGGTASEWVASASFAVLSLLPAVLLDLALGGAYAWLRWSGYAVSAVAALAHLSEAAGVGVASHEFGLKLITFGFGGLAVAAAVGLWRGRARRRAASMRAVAAMSLFLLAASFVHFGAEHGPGSWAHELIFHHAGIPLALFVLLQDYRFLLLDVFVRFLGAGLLALGFASAVIWLGGALGLLTIEGLSGVAFVTLVSAALLIFPYVRDRLKVWVQSALFHRGDVESVVTWLQRLRPAGEEALFQQAAARIAQFVSTGQWRLLPPAETARRAGVELPPAWPGEPSASDVPAWAEVEIVFRVSAIETRSLLLGPREGGRRYLSEDIADLDVLAAELGSKLAALRDEERRRLLEQAELETLRAQINPHFLFNALNALYGIIPRSAAQARRTLLNLADIFRYSIEGNRQLAPLEEELRIVEAYLQIERLRLGERLTTKMEVDDEAGGVRVPALSIQPLVENAVKHGISARAEGGVVRVAARLREDGLHVTVADDGGGFDVERAREGHGLANVRRRLELYGERGVELAVTSSKSGTEIRFCVPQENRPAATPKPNEVTQQA